MGKNAAEIKRLHEAAAKHLSTREPLKAERIKNKG